MTSLGGSVISILLIVLGIYVAISVVAGHAGHMLPRSKCAIWQGYRLANAQCGMANPDKMI